MSKKNMLIMLFFVLKNVFVFGQGCGGYEQKAFDFFIMHITKDSDLNSLKFCLEDSFVNKYSQFNSNRCFKTSESSNVIEMPIFNGVRIVATLSNDSITGNPYDCSFVKFPDSSKYLFVKNRLRHRKRSRLLQIYRATRFKENYYVEFKIIGTENIIFFMVEIDNNKNIKRWFEQSVTF